jgi:DNA-binding transcriptional ArsR family regulator/uncharacterized protein YndB with AHSA1/START domain
VSTDTSAGFSALGDPSRRLIVSRLAHGPTSVADIARGLPVSRTAVSMHLRVLKEAGLVLDQPVGARRLYQLNPPALAALRDYLDWYWTHALATFKSAAEQHHKGATTAVPPEVKVSKFIVVDVPLAQAFDFFIHHERWWPVKTHHLAEPACDSAVLEPFVGGRWYERAADGREVDWGRVLVWEPPHRIVLTFQITSRWVYEPDPARASEVEVRFIPDASRQRTRVEFEHRHLERYAEQTERMRSVLDAPSGAAGVLDAYSESLSAATFAST